MELLAACHLHSEWSYDGSWTLEGLCARFSRLGYRVLMMTEHDRGFTSARLKEYRDACSRASTDKMLVVPGIEYSDAANRLHVLMWGPVPFLGAGLPTNEMLEAAKAFGGLAVFAHPSRRDAWTSFESSWTDKLLGIEIWNRKYDGWAPSQKALALQSASPAIQFVGLDFHTARQGFPLGMALDIQGDILEETVIEALRSRRCRARAFKRPLNGRLVRNGLPILRIAERGRRTAASIARYARGFVKGLASAKVSR